MQLRRSLKVDDYTGCVLCQEGEEGAEGSGGVAEGEEAGGESQWRVYEAVAGVL